MDVWEGALVKLRKPEVPWFSLWHFVSILQLSCTERLPFIKMSGSTQGGWRHPYNIVQPKEFQHIVWTAVPMPMCTDPPNHTDPWCWDFGDAGGAVLAAAYHGGLGCTLPHDRKDPQGAMSPTPISTLDYLRIKPYVWEHYPNASWTLLLAATFISAIIPQTGLQYQPEEVMQGEVIWNKEKLFQTKTE